MTRALLALPGLALLATFLVAAVGMPADAVVSASNGRIAFASDRDGDFEIYTIDPDGTDLLQITHNAVDDDDPAWSPDGTRLAFVRTGSCETKCTALWVMDAEGSDQVQITSWSNAIQETAPTWASTTTLLFTSNRVPGGGLQPREIWSIPAAGGTPIQLTDEGNVASYVPDVSPDGASVVFASDRDGAGRLFTMTTDGASETVVVLSGNDVASTFAKDPSWAPGDDRFAFTGSSVSVATPPDLYVADIDGSGSDVVYDPGDQPVYTPSWAPDGTRMVLTVDTAGTTNLQLRVLNPATGNAITLASHAADERNPSWQPLVGSSPSPSTSPSSSPSTSTSPSSSPSTSPTTSPTTSPSTSPTTSPSTSPTTSPTTPPTPPADGVHVDLVDFAFDPATPEIGRGDTLVFDFVGPSTHTATDASGLELYDSGNVGAGGPSTWFTFEAAGTYAFTCTPHPFMGGRVKVPMRGAPASGGPNRTFTLTWASEEATGDHVYDVQIRRPGRAWWSWRKGVTIRTDMFEPNGTGRYRFRARMRDVGLGEASRWSAAVSIRVT